MAAIDAVQLPDATPLSVALPVADAVDAPAVAVPASDIWQPAGGADLYRGIYLRSGVAAPGTYVITSSCRGEGRTTVGLGLATTMAQDFPDEKIAFVELDFEQPALARVLDVPAGPGVLECIANGDLLPAACRPTPLDNLSVVLAGVAVRSSDAEDPAAGTPTRWLSARRLPGVLAALRQTHDVVILDAPAVVGNAGVQGLIRSTDGTLFVVRGDATPAPIAREALRQVDPAKLRGVVLNRTRSAMPGWVRRLAGF